MDPYSEILSGLKLKGAIFFRGEFSAPWFINAPPSPQLAAALGLQDAHVVNFQARRASSCLPVALWV
jgi:hypothetical protein